METKELNRATALAIVILVAVLLVLIAGGNIPRWLKPSPTSQTAVVAANQPSQPSQADLEQAVLPARGLELPVRWGDLGPQLVAAGVIDRERFEAIYAQRGGLDEEERQLAYGVQNGNLKITPQNANFVLNLLWALGLGNENKILTQGPMASRGLEDAGRLASTGGWTLATGASAMEHYSKHRFIALTQDQQELVERVASNIYRPCCNNPTSFPDCNHGMAMLGLLELMASQGVSEAEMYRVALQVNSYWFPDTYLTVATYFARRGVPWDKVDPREVLGVNYSSGSGYQRVRAEVEPPQSQGAGSCGI